MACFIALWLRDFNQTAWKLPGFCGSVWQKVFRILLGILDFVVGKQRYLTCPNFVQFSLIYVFQSIVENPISQCCQEISRLHKKVLTINL